MQEGTGPPSADLLGDSDPLAELARWSAAARVDDAARSRARERWLRQVAAEEASFAGVLVDLAEQGRPVIVTTTNGRRHRGVLRGVAPDFCALRADSGHDVLLSHHGVTGVRPDPRADELAGARTLGLDLTLAEALARLSADRPRVLIVSEGASDTVRGDLHSVGTDVVAIRLDGSPRTTAYLRLASVVEVVVEAR